MWPVRICRRIRRRHISVFFLPLIIWGLTWLVWSVVQQHSSPSDRKLPARFTWNQTIVDVEPSVDNSSQPSDGQLLIQLKKQLPSLPISFWHRNMNRGLFFNNNTCARYPDIFELEFNNLYWQSLRTTNGTFHLYGAYYDIRELSEIGPAVRILGMIDRIDPTVKTYCQIWFDHHRQPVFAEVIEYSHIWNKFWGNYEQGILQPYLMACQIPEEFQKLVPASVSIVEEKCDIAKNNLRVIYKKPYETKNFAVCVKGLDFSHSDLSVRLVEWIELLGILGADKVFFYQFKVHSNISKVLKYYKKRNRIEVTHLTLPGGQPNIPALRSLYLKKNRGKKRLNELIPYNDCLYKNLYTYDYIALLDIDEVIMPLEYANWKQLMDVVEKKAYEETASYCVRNVYFFDRLLDTHGWFKDIPKYMHMLQHVYRSANFTKPRHYVKCLHSTELVKTLHNHYPVSCLDGECETYDIDEKEDAKLNHYRKDCVDTVKNECAEMMNNTVLDTAIWAHKQELSTKVTEVLDKLGFFSRNSEKN